MTPFCLEPLATGTVKHQKAHDKLRNVFLQMHVPCDTQREKQANAASLKGVINSSGCCRDPVLPRLETATAPSSAVTTTPLFPRPPAQGLLPAPQGPLPEFFWLVTGLPSLGTACWNTCTVSCTTCRCRHTSSGSLTVATFWASRNCGSARSRRVKAAAFSVLSPGGHGAAVTAGAPGTDTPPPQHPLPRQPPFPPHPALLR